MFLFSFLKCFSQREFKYNLWQSVSGRFTSRNIEFSSEFGYRSCDFFVKSPRNVFGRIILEYKILRFNHFGLGFAYFEHFSDNLDTRFENRPFFQYRVENSICKMAYKFRFRNELRLFNDHNFSNRLRIQGGINFISSDRLHPYFSVEYFYTPGKQELFEQRYNIGITKRTKNIQSSFFYILQRQSNVQYLQNIIGYQIHFFMN